MQNGSPQDKLGTQNQRWSSDNRISMGTGKSQILLFDYLQFRTWKTLKIRVWIPYPDRVLVSQTHTSLANIYLFPFIDKSKKLHKEGANRAPPYYKKRRNEPRRYKRKPTKGTISKAKKLQTPKTTATLVTRLYHPPTIITRTLMPFRLPLILAETLYLDISLSYFTNLASCICLLSIFCHIRN